MLGVLPKQDWLTHLKQLHQECAVLSREWYNARITHMCVELLQFYVVAFSCDGDVADDATARIARNPDPDAMYGFMYMSPVCRPNSACNRKLQRARHSTLSEILRT